MAWSISQLLIQLRALSGGIEVPIHSDLRLDVRGTALVGICVESSMDEPLALVLPTPEASPPKR